MQYRQNIESRVNFLIGDLEKYLNVDIGNVEIKTHSEFLKEVSDECRKKEFSRNLLGKIRQSLNRRFQLWNAKRHLIGYFFEYQFR